MIGKLVTVAICGLILIAITGVDAPSITEILLY